MIQLESLWLRNFCQHRNFRQDFQKGVIGLLGTIGAGKSNLIYAIQASLTDDFKALGTKQSCINWNCGKKRESFLEAVWNLHGTRVCIRRSLRPNGSTLTLLDGGEMFEGRAAVSTELGKLIGIPEKVLANYVFVEQWQTFAFISQNPAERAKLFSHLCGTEELSLLHKWLGEQSVADFALVTEIDEDERKALLKQKKTLCKRLQDLDAQLASTKRDSEKLDVAKIKKAYLNVTKAGAIMLAAAKLTPRIENARKHIRALRDQIGELRKITDVGLKKRRDAHEALMQRYHAHKYAPTVPERPKQPAKVAPGPKRVSQLQTALTTSIQEMGRWQTSYKFALKGESVCGECGTKLKFTEKDRLHCKKQLQQAKERMEAAKSALDSANRLAGKWEEYAADLTKYKKLKAESDTLSAQNGGGPPPTIYETGESKKKLSRYEEKHHSKKEAIKFLKDKKLLLSTLIAEDQEASLQIEALLNEVEELNVGANDKEIAENLQKASRLGERLKGLDSEREQVLQTQAQVLKQLKKIRLAREKSAKAVKWLEDVDFLREVLHHTALPRDIALARLNALKKPINATLQKFDLDFTVEPDEALSFAVRTASGKMTTASRLSGGQKMLLAISFWLAINSVFVADVGFLTLDEPTAGLNRESIQSLADVLSVFSKAAKKAGRQVIVVTHEHALRKVFDQCVELPPQ